MTKGTFRTDFDQYRDRDGERFTFVRVVDTPDEHHDAEVLPMYVIRFDDGVEIEAWPEEVGIENNPGERNVT